MPINPSSNRIMIAGDDPLIRELVAAIVTKLGYAPVTLNDGRAAFGLLNADSDFKAAILGMSMPYFEGLDLIRYLRTEMHLLHIPVVLITDGQSIKLMADSFAAGASAFLPKPFTQDQLQRLLRMLLAPQLPTARAA